MTWQVHGGDPIGIIVERQTEEGIQERGRWDRMAKLPATATEYNDSGVKKGQVFAYRVRAINDNGESAYSNIARITYGSP